MWIRSLSKPTTEACYNTVEWSPVQLPRCATPRPVEVSKPREDQPGSGCESDVRAEGSLQVQDRLTALHLIFDNFFKIFSGLSIQIGARPRANFAAQVEAAQSTLGERGPYHKAARWRSLSWAEAVCFSFRTGHKKSIVPQATAVTKPISESQKRLPNLGTRTILRRATALQINNQDRPVCRSPGAHR